MNYSDCLRKNIDQFGGRIVVMTKNSIDIDFRVFLNFENNDSYYVRFARSINDIVHIKYDGNDYIVFGVRFDGVFVIDDLMAVSFIQNPSSYDNAKLLYANANIQKFAMCFYNFYASIYVVRSYRRKLSIADYNSAAELVALGSSVISKDPVPALFEEGVNFCKHIENGNFTKFWEYEWILFSDNNIPFEYGISQLIRDGFMTYTEAGMNISDI